MPAVTSQNCINICGGSTQTGANTVSAGFEVTRVFDVILRVCTFPSCPSTHLSACLRLHVCWSTTHTYTPARVR